MTCIVGGIDNKKTVWIAGDSAGVNGYSLHVRKDPKVFTRRTNLAENNIAIAFGYTSSFRMGQLLQYSFEIPNVLPGPEETMHRWMCLRFVPAVKKCFVDGGWIRKSDERISGGIFLVGIRGHLFRVDNDFQVGEVMLPYDAVGCGEEFALGAMRAMQLGCVDTVTAVKDAVRIAEHFSAGVRGPVNIVGVTVDGEIAHEKESE